MFSRHAPKRKKSTTSSTPDYLYNSQAIKKETHLDSCNGVMLQTGTNTKKTEKLESSGLTNDNHKRERESPEKSILETPILHNTVAPNVRINGVVSHALRKSVNGYMWLAFLEEIKKKRSSPILVWGPTGSGKTKGVKDCASACGLKVFEIEPSVLETTKKLEDWFTHIAMVKTLLGPRLLLIDVIEGIDEMYISVLQKLFTKNCSFNIPIVLIADDAYNYTLRSLFQLIPNKFKCLRQFPSHCAEFAKLTFAKAVPREKIDYHAQFCNGDLRNLKLRLGIGTMLSGSFANSKDMFGNIFESTHNLIENTLSVDKWIESRDSNQLLHIVHDNYVHLMDDLEMICELSDHTTLHIKNEYKLHLCGVMFTKMKSKTKKLTLQPMVKENLRMKPKTISEYSHSFCHLDMISLLLNPQTFYTEKSHI